MYYKITVIFILAFELKINKEMKKYKYEMRNQDKEKAPDLEGQNDNYNCPSNRHLPRFPSRQPSIKACFPTRNTEREVFTTLMFLNELKRQVQILYGKRLSNEKLSLILGQTKKHIEHNFHKARHRPDFKIALDFLEEYEINLMFQFKERSINAINTIKKYRDLNKLPRSTKKKHLIFHPNLKPDYFEVIDTIEKAYWLGWLYAEGWIQKPWENKDHVIGVGVSKKDVLQLFRFIETIGLNAKFIQYKKGKQRVKNYEDADYLEMAFQCRDIKENLIKHGFIVGKMKSYHIELPDLNSRELYLAFLLGYFDGDGDQGTSLINCRSKKFLSQIKELFNIEYDIKYKESKGGYIDGRFVKGSVYRLTLGADLFNEMLDNYQNSMPRKRIRMQSSKEKAEHAIKLAQAKKKFGFTKKGLKTLVWLMPHTEIAKLHKELFGVSINNHLVGDYCRNWNIKIPPLGYWNRKENLNN